MFKKSFWGGEREERVIDNIKRHIKILCSACETFKRGLEEENEDLMLGVSDLEREGDIVRREVIANIYEGAFLPFLRPNICKFVEIVDNAIDKVEDTAQKFIMNLKLEEETKNDCVKIADLNLKICQMLLLTFEALLGGEDLREKNLAIRIYEKKVDEIKFYLIKKLIKKEVKNFWEGKILSDFISHLTNVSDIIEDAGDYLQIINVSIR
ncbi:MAG: TIGR00153 family protein [Candidatus Desulfofervidaceae bacterium]|nr:TIGR00153 family protein [Candidatus Desulfofervidaceae bacterium]